jgi:hypothetical protein
LAGAITISGTRLPASYGILFGTLSVVMLSATVVVFWAVASRGIGRRIHALIHRLTHDATVASTGPADQRFGRDVDVAVLALARGPRRKLVGGVVIHAVGKLAMLLEVLVAFRLLGKSIGLADGFVIAVVPIASSVFFSSIPSQIGVQEGAALLVGGGIGLPVTTILAVSLLQRLRQLSFVVVTAIAVSILRPRT